MDSRKKIYIQYAAIFVLIMLLGSINFIIKTSDVWRGNLTKYEYTTLMPKELVDLMNQNKELIIIDTRIKEYFKEGHIKGALNLSHTNMKTMNKVLRKDMAKDIVIYSEDGEMAKKIGDTSITKVFSGITSISFSMK